MSGLLWYTFLKREENVPGAIGTFFENGRKMSGVIGTLFENGRTMSLVSLPHFLKMGGKCPWCHWHTFWKREENVQGAIGTIFEMGGKCLGCFGTLSKNGRKMSWMLSVQFLKMGGKCL